MDRSIASAMTIMHCQRLGMEIPDEPLFSVIQAFDILKREAVFRADGLDKSIRVRIRRQIPFEQRERVLFLANILYRGFRMLSKPLAAPGEGQPEVRK